MDVITTIVVWVFTLIAELVTTIFAYDICASADFICAKIIHYSARRLAVFDQEAVELEWLGDLSERETVFDKYRHAIGCYVAAGGMRRRALAVAIELKFRVIGVGAVPLTLKLGPPLVVSAFFAATGPRMPRLLSKTLMTAFVVYALAKLLLSVHRLGPGSLHRFLDQLKQYKKWGYQAHVRRKGIDLNVSNTFRAMVIFPKRIPEITEKLCNIFEKKPGS